MVEEADAAPDRRGGAGKGRTQGAGTERVRIAMAVLAGLFALRVVLQALQAIVEVPGLPAFDAWDSGVVAYPWLLAAQVAILVGMAWLAGALDDRRRPRLGLAALILGGVYFAVMLGRGTVGIAGPADGGWFDAPLATPVHLVLAAALMVLGGHWRRGGGPRPRDGRAVRFGRVAAFPLVVAGAIVVYGWALRSGVPAMFVAYFAATLGTGAVVVLEQLMPYRTDWQLSRGDAATDGLYLALVQLALPAGLAAGAVAVAGGLGLTAGGVWPASWPVAAQVVLMILLADLARYWLHRAAHGRPALWRLHAVHHAPETLHALNVGRFHPLEKGLQFLLDALPFILLGVPEAVIGGYLVFYAVNGFFQHCNADVRLGWLNWIVSGPELHRWHHARAPWLSHHNFGNNLIVWDALFGTRYLPRRRPVPELGLLDRAYPRAFLRQMAAPLRPRPDRGEGW